MRVTKCPVCKELNALRGEKIAQKRMKRHGHQVEDAHKVVGWRVCRECKEGKHDQKSDV